MSFYGDNQNPFKNNPLADFFAGLGQFGKKFGEVSRQTQSAQVNPYGRGPITRAPSRQPGMITSQDYDKAERRRLEQAAGQYKAPKPSAGGGGQMGSAGQRFGQPTGGAGGGGPISDMYDPLFKLIESQRLAADARYAANQGNIENIYGQLSTARRNDVASTTAAYKALSDAAAARSTAANTAIGAGEAERLSQNQAIMSSLGLGGVAAPTGPGDVAAEQAATAQNVGNLNAANWQGMLSAMGANAQDVIGQDVQSYGYQQGRDIQSLQKDLQSYQQALDTRQFETQAEKAKVKFQYNQAQKAAQASAAASAANRAASASNAADKAAAARTAELLKYADPLTKALTTGIGLGYTNFDPDKVQKAYNSWMVNRGSNPTAAGLKTWTKLTAGGDALKYTKGQLSADERRVLNDAISNSF